MNDPSPMPPPYEVGTVLFWEPRSTHAAARFTVTQARWNGEEWWFAGRETPDSTEFWNDLDRMREAAKPDTQHWRDVFAQTMAARQLTITRYS